MSCLYLFSLRIEQRLFLNLRLDLDPKTFHADKCSRLRKFDGEICVGNAFVDRVSKSARSDPSHNFAIVTNRLTAEHKGIGVIQCDTTQFLFYPFGLLFLK